MMRLPRFLLKPLHGPVATIVGVVFSTFSQGLGNPVVSWIGYGITLYGILLVLYRSNMTAEDTANVLGRFETQISRLIRLFEIEKMTNDQNDIIRKSALQTLAGYINITIPSLTEQVKSFQEKDSTSLQLTNRDLVERSPLDLLKLLPNGSVWLGISLMNQQNWRTTHLNNFVAESRNLTSTRKLLMRRIYVSEGKDIAVTPAMISEDIQAGIQLKHLPENGAGLVPDPKDISLVWEPSKTNDRATIPAQLTIPPSPDLYRPVGALLFELDSHNALVQVTIFHAESTEFRSYVRHFTSCWEQAEHLS